MDERDVERVARAIVNATGVQWPDPSLLGPWLKSARAAMAARDEQLRARLVSDQALEVLASTMNNGPFGEPERAVGWLRALASFVFGPAPRVEPIDRAFTDGEEPAESIHRARRPAPMPMASPVTDAEVEVAVEAYRAARDAGKGEYGMRNAAGIRDALTAFAAGRVATPLPDHSGCVCATCGQRRTESALAARRAEQAEAEVTRLTAERDAAVMGREEAFRARDEASLRLNAECVRLTAALAEAEKSARESDALSVAYCARIASAQDERDSAPCILLNANAAAAAAQAEAESLRAEVATCRHIIETAERMRDAAVKRAYEANIRANTEAAAHMEARREFYAATRRAEEAGAFRLAIAEAVGKYHDADGHPRYPADDETLVDEAKRLAAVHENHIAVVYGRLEQRGDKVVLIEVGGKVAEWCPPLALRASPVPEAVRDLVKAVQDLADCDQQTIGSVLEGACLTRPEAERFRALCKRLPAAEAAIASQPDVTVSAFDAAKHRFTSHLDDADAQAGEVPWPAFPEPHDGDPIDDHMRRVSDHVRDVLALVRDATRKGGA